MSANQKKPSPIGTTAAPRTSPPLHPITITARTMFLYGGWCGGEGRKGTGWFCFPSGVEWGSVMAGLARWFLEGRWKDEGRSLFLFGVVFGAVCFRTQRTVDGGSTRAGQPCGAVRRRRPCGSGTRAGQPCGASVHRSRLGKRTSRPSEISSHRLATEQASRDLVSANGPCRHMIKRRLDL